MAPANEIRHALYQAGAVTIAETVAIEHGVSLPELLSGSDPAKLEPLWYRLSLGGLGSKRLVKIFRVRIDRIQAAIRKHRDAARPEPVTHTLTVDGYPCEIEEVGRAS